MELRQAIKTRTAIRTFSHKHVSNKTIKIILDAGRLAPSSKNSQPCNYIVIKDRELLKKISQCTYSGDFLALAPVGIAIFTINAKLAEIDAARAIQNMMLMAHSIGIGSCWITNYWEDKVKELLDIPKSGNYKLITVIPIGYPHRTVLKPHGNLLRNNIKEIVFKEKFGIQLKFDE